MQYVRCILVYSYRPLVCVCVCVCVYVCVCMCACLTLSEHTKTLQINPLFLIIMYATKAIHFEYIEFGRKIMFIKLKLNKNRFFTGFGRFRQECTSPEINEVWIDFFPRLGPTFTISNTSNLEVELCL